MSKKYVIALDIGGTNYRCALINREYEIVKVLIKPTKKGSVELFLKQASDIIKEIEFNRDEVLGIVAGVPGKVRHDGHIDNLPNIGIFDIPLKSYLEKEFNLPTIIKNDAEIAAVAEGHVGVGKGADNCYFITISTGLGGCFFEKGKIKNVSEEIGHTLVEYKGNSYEIEKIASGNGIVTLAALNNLEVKSSKIFFDLVRNKDKKALVVYKEWLKLINDFLSYIEYIYEPQVIAITGGVMKSKDLFFADLVSAYPKLTIKEAKFKFDAGLIGAAALGFLSF